MSAHSRPISLRRIARVVNGGTPTADPVNWDGNILWATPVDIGRMHGGWLQETDRKITVAGSENGAPIVPPGSVLLSTRAPVGYVAVASTAVAFNQGCRALVPHASTVDPRFLSYVLQSASDTIAAAAQGTTFVELSSANLAQSQVPWAPSDQQRLIADFLDHETAEIDAFTEDLDSFQALSLQRMESLRNKLVCQPSASDPVTGGNGYVALTRALPHRVDYRGATPTKTSSGIQLVTAGNIRSGWVDYEVPREFVAQEEYDHVMRRGKPALGDILFTMEAPLGNAALVDRVDIALAQRVIKLRTSPIIMPKFAMMAMNSSTFQSQLAVRATGSTALGLKASKLSELYLYVPDVGAQNRAIREWEKAEGEVQQLVLDAAQARQLARERRTALISAAVTGQIDVMKKHKPAAEALEDELETVR